MMNFMKRNKFYLLLTMMICICWGCKSKNMNTVTNEKAESTIVEFTEKVGPDGRTFGSITNKKIAEELQKQFGIKIDKRHIQVQAPIRAVGLIDVPVKIYQDITSVINLRVKEG